MWDVQHFAYWIYNKNLYNLFTLWASRFHRIRCVAGHSQWSTTASWPAPCVCGKLGLWEMRVRLQMVFTTERTENTEKFFWQLPVGANAPWGTGKRDERRTSNVQHRMMNKEFCQFINWWSGATSLFDVQCSMLDVHFYVFTSFPRFCMGTRDATRDAFPRAWEREITRNPSIRFLP